MLKPLTPKQQYWSDHLAKADKFDGCLAGYAKANNLSVQKLYQWRNMLKDKTPDKQNNDTRFAKVVTSSSFLDSSLTLQINNAQLRFSQLPSPTWLASFLDTQL